MLRNNVDARRCSYLELGLPVGTVALKTRTKKEWRTHTGHSESIFKPATMNFAVGFDLIKAASQFAGTNVKRIAAFRVDWVYN